MLSSSQRAPFLSKWLPPVKWRGCRRSESNTRQPLVWWGEGGGTAEEVFPVPALPLASIRVIGLSDLSRHSIPPSGMLIRHRLGVHCAITMICIIWWFQSRSCWLVGRQSEGPGEVAAACPVNYDIALIWCVWLDVCTSHNRCHKLNTRPDIWQYINYFSWYLPNSLLVCLGVDVEPIAGKC